MNNFFRDCRTLEEIKNAYRKLVREHHPDLGGDEEVMKALNFAYEQAIRSGRFAEEMNRTKTNIDQESAFRDILERLIVLQGLVLEICGSWLWVTGNTYHYKDFLKEHGLKWASKKKAWFWRPDDAKVRTRGELSMDDIRWRHGSQIITTRNINALARSES